MIVYLSVIALILFLTINIEKQKTVVNGCRRYSQMGNLQIILCASVLIFVSGFRWKVGTDFGAYISLYSRLKKEWLYSIMTFDEPGIAVLSKVGSLIYDSPIILFVLTAFITVSLYVITIKKYCNLFQMGILLFVFIGSWHGSFNAMRQYLAAAVIFAGHRFIYEKKILKYLLVVVLACCFHITALVMLPIYFLVNKKVSLKSICVIVGMVLLIRYSYDYLFAIMSFIKESDQTQYAYMLRDVNSTRIVVAFAPLLVALLAKDTKEIQNPETQFYMMLLIVNAGFIFGTSGSAYLARIGIYTECFGTLALPRLMNCFKRDSKKLAILIILVLYFIFWFYELHARGLFDFQWSFGRF